MRPVRRWILRFAFTAVTSLAAVGPSLAGSVSHITFDPPAGLIECDGTLTVGLRVDEAAQDLRGFSLVVAFDPSIVEVQSVSPGPLMSGPCPSVLYPTFPAGADSVAIDGAGLGCSVNGPGVIATIVFHALPQQTYPAYSPLVWRSLILRDGGNATIPSLGEPGYIDVTCVTSVETTSWGRTKASYREARPR